MLIVQYPMQFNISNPCSARANGGSNITTRAHAFHALLLPSKLNDFQVEDRDIHNFALTGLELNSCL